MSKILNLPLVNAHTHAAMIAFRGIAKDISQSHSCGLFGKIRILDNKTVLAHCVWVNDEDIDIRHWV